MTTAKGVAHARCFNPQTPTRACLQLFLPGRLFQDQGSWSTRSFNTRGLPKGGRPDTTNPTLTPTASEPQHQLLRP